MRINCKAFVAKVTTNPLQMFVHAAARHCLQLQFLHVEGGLFTDDMLLALTNNAPYLRGLQVVDASQVTAAGVENVLTKCRKLDTIGFREDTIGFLDNSEDIQRPVWTKLLQSCSALQTLRLGMCPNLDLGAIAQLRCLRDFQIQENHHIKDDWLLNLAKANPNMTHLQVTGSYGISYKVVHPLLTCCPQLRKLWLTTWCEGRTRSDMCKLLGAYVSRAHPKLEDVLLDFTL
jgi:hypothetical protein